MRLHGFCRSSASWRVRIALGVKQVSFDQATYHLRNGEQRSAAYLAINPEGLVPAFELDDHDVLTQSLAIREYLDETIPEPPLLPADPRGRAKVRALAQQLGSIYERLLEFDVVRDEAGALDVRPNLFARQNSGSYYTPDELVALILDETLEPLIAERLDAFPDVHRQFKFVTLVTSPDRAFASASCAFFLQDVRERLDPQRGFGITAADFAKVNPNTGTAPIFRSRRDMGLTTAIYARLPVLVDRSAHEPAAAWPVRYVRMFDMTNDSHLFRTRAELEEREGAWSIGGNRFQSAAGEWVPLYEGKMIYPFDHRFADVTVNAENQYRPAGSTILTTAEHADPARLPQPQFWVRRDGAAFKNEPTLAFRDVTNPTDRLTMVAAIIPHSAAGNTLPVVEMEDPSGTARSCLLANFSAKVFDYLCRQKIQKNHLNWYIVEHPGGPACRLRANVWDYICRRRCPRSGPGTSYTANDIAPLARDMGHIDAKNDVLPPFIWNEDRRLHLCAKLDALYFILYGVFDPADPAQSRDDIRYIYSTFPIVEREEIAKWGSYRSRDLCLAYVNALIAGQPDAAVDG